MRAPATPEAALRLGQRVAAERGLEVREVTVRREGEAWAVAVHVTRPSEALPRSGCVHLSHRPSVIVTWYEGRAAMVAVAPEEFDRAVRPFMGAT